VSEAGTEGLRYTSEHEWVRDEGELLRIGITAFAQDQLGDVVRRPPGPARRSSRPVVRRGRVDQVGLRPVRADLRDRRRAQRGARRATGAGQRRPVRRRLADRDPPERDRSSSTGCSTKPPTRADPDSADPSGGRCELSWSTLARSSLGGSTCEVEPASPAGRRRRADDTERSTSARRRTVHCSHCGEPVAEDARTSAPTAAPPWRTPSPPEDTTAAIEVGALDPQHDVGRPARRRHPGPGCWWSSAGPTPGRASCSTGTPPRSAGTRTRRSSSTTSPCRAGTPSSCAPTGHDRARPRQPQRVLRQRRAGRRAALGTGDEVQIGRFKLLYVGAGEATRGPVTTHTIGEVLNRLKDEFDDITISKIRFLEAEGLISPDRTESGYRKFTPADVDRLRYVLRAQRTRSWDWRAPVSGSRQATPGRWGSFSMRSSPAAATTLRKRSRSMSAGPGRRSST
jgi:hypothetical protein